MEEKETDFIEKIYRLCERYNISHGMRYDFVSEVKGIIKEGKSVDGEKLNLKPFDIQKAREGKPVCTRDGHKARIICFDLKNQGYPIVAAIGDDSSEILLNYTINGEVVKGACKSPKDLMMLPEKKEGWVNVYKVKESPFGYITSYFDTEENAKEDKELPTEYVATVKINWSE